MAKLAGAMLASLSQAVYLFNAPLAQAARLPVRSRRRSSRPLDPRGGAGEPAAADEEPAAD